MPLLREELQRQGPPLAVNLLAQAQGCVLRFGASGRVFRLLEFTQPHNRGAFDLHLDQAFRRARRQRAPCA